MAEFRKSRLASGDLRDIQARPAPRARAARSYYNAQPGRLTSGWQSPTSSADSELQQGLRLLRNRSRALVRDSGYAKRAKVVVMNNVVGSGIGMQAQVRNARGTLIDAVNDGLETAWADWCRPVNCHTGGRLAFPDIERMAVGQVFEAGDVVIRQHYRPFGTSPIPLALELIESERLADDYAMLNGTLQGELRMGIEVDEFGRALAAWVHRYHPGELRYRPTTPDQLIRVPASDYYHLFICDRWPQTRGEPWLHTAARRLNDMDGYSEAEIVAARSAALYMGFIQQPDAADPSPPPVTADGVEVHQEFDLEPAAVKRLAPGETFNFAAPNRPNPNFEAFMRAMLREAAAGSMVTYEGISGDLSQSNFSSSRMGQMDARDQWRAIQQWFIRAFRCELHRTWVRQAVLARAIPAIDVLEYANNPTKFEAVAFKARGWTYINPKDDIAAAKEAIAAGLSTRTYEIATYGDGRDIEDVDRERRRELDFAESLDLEYDTDPEFYMTKGPPVATDTEASASSTKAGQEPTKQDDGEDPSQRVVPLKGRA